MGTSSFIEALEARIAPATFVNATTAIYDDPDGDHVTVKFSKPLLTLGNLGTVLVTAASGLGEQLQMIDLTGIGNAAQGTGILFKVSKVGDGLVDVGFINATGVDLGQVSIPGDLGRVIAGDDDPAPGLAGLKVNSIGGENLSTQGGTGDLHSVITGPLGKLSVSGDVVNAFIQVNGTSSNASAGRIGSVFIGSDLVGNGSDNSGSIVSSGNIGSVKVLGDVVGASGLNSGNISSGGKITNVNVGGDLVGSAGNNSGRIASVGDMGPVKITGDLVGSSGDFSGSVESTSGKIASATIGDGIDGSNGLHSGSLTSKGDMGPVKVVNDLDGSDGDFSGSIFSGGKLAVVTIGGNLFGGSGLGSGFISSKLDMGPVKIGGDVSGSDGQSSGSILAGLEELNTDDDPTLNNHKLGNVTIGHLDKNGEVVGGILDGGSGFNSGLIQSGGNMGFVKIVGDEDEAINGGGGESSGGIECNGKLAGAFLGGDLSGSSGEDSGEIFGRFGIGKVTVTGSVRAGSGGDSGEIDTDNDDPNIHAPIGKIIIGGSLIGSTDPAAFSSGLIFSDGDIGFLQIGGDLTGGAGDHSGHVTVHGKLGTVIIGGTMSTGSGVGSGRIDCDLSIGFAKVGEITGSSTNHAVISALNAVKKLTVTGDATYFDALAGYVFDPNDPSSDIVAKNPNATIGSVVIGGNLIQSNLVAGVMDGGMDGFGDANDVKIAPDADTILSSIASVVVKGTISNNTAGAEHFGITAEWVKKVVIGHSAVPLQRGPSSDSLLLIPGASDYFINEV